MLDVGLQAVRLNLGCGDHRAPSPWVNIDSQGSVSPDLIADVGHLPYRGCVAERIYLGHVLEHLAYPSAVVSALAECYRVLRPDGELLVVGPDCDRAIAFDDQTALGALVGARRWEGDRHQWACTEERLLALVRGFWPSARAVPVEEIGESWPLVSRIGWQCAVMWP